MSKPLSQTRRLRRAGATQFYLFASPMIGHQPALGGAVFPIKGEDPLAAPYLRIDKVTLEIEVGLSRHDGSPFLSAEIPDFSLQPIGVISAPENWLAHDLWNVGIGELNIITVRVDQIGLIGFNDRGGFLQNSGGRTLQSSDLWEPGIVENPHEAHRRNGCERASDAM
jgi:hypothetical protein